MFFLVITQFFLKEYAKLILRENVNRRLKMKISNLKIKFTPHQKALGINPRISGAGSGFASTSRTMKPWRFTVFILTILVLGLLCPVGYIHSGQEPEPITLHEGWNLISIPVDTENYNLETVLARLDYSIVQTYEPTSTDADENGNLIYDRAPRAKEHLRTLSTARAIG